MYVSVNTLITTEGYPSPPKKIKGDQDKLCSPRAVIMMQEFRLHAILVTEFG